MTAISFDSPLWIDFSVQFTPIGQMFAICWVDVK